MFNMLSTDPDSFAVINEIMGYEEDENKKPEQRSARVDCGGMCMSSCTGTCAGTCKGAGEG